MRNPLFREGNMQFQKYIYIYYIYICWRDYVPFSHFSTTRMIAFLVGDPELNLRLPFLLEGEASRWIYIYKYMLIMLENIIICLQQHENHHHHNNTDITEPWPETSFPSCWHRVWWPYRSEVPCFDGTCRVTTSMVYGSWLMENCAFGCVWGGKSQSWTFFVAGI